MELAGANDIEPEETEVVRKMVHHFEATTTKNDDTSNSNKTRSAAKANFQNDTALTINNQTTVACQDEKGDNDNHQKVDGQSFSPSSACGASAAALIIDKNNHDCGIKLVTVNNHINIGRGNSAESGQNKGSVERMENAENLKQTEEQQKTYQSEAKDIHLDNGGKGPRQKEGGSNAGTCVKICRNKNVDLAFTFVKQQPTKASGISAEINKCNTHIGKQSSANINNPSREEKQTRQPEDNLQRKSLTYENTLLPTITATTEIRHSDKMTIGDITVDDEQPNKSRLQPYKPAQIIVPVDIHRVDSSSIKKQESTSSSVAASPFFHQNAKAGHEEKTFLPLSTTSSVTSIIDRTVVKHYVANDKSIYEKRKYDDIEFEEFEVYDPTKDFEKLIEEEQKRHSTDAQFAINHCDDTQQPQQQHPTNSSSSSMSSSTSKVSHTSSMATAKSQQTFVSTETETDCYDSLDDKL